MVAIGVLKELIIEITRHRADKQANAVICQILNPSN
jgi:hypothetical protein